MSLDIGVMHFLLYAVDYTTSQNKNEENLKKDRMPLVALQPGLSLDFFKIIFHVTLSLATIYQLPILTIFVSLGSHKSG